VERPPADDLHLVRAAHRPADIELAVHWALGPEGVFLNTVSDVDLLPHVLAAAESFDGTRPSDERMRDLVERRSLAPLFV